MSMEIKVDLSKSGLTMEEIRQKKLEIDTALERLWSGKETFTGWVKLPLQQDKNEMERILNVSDIIRQQCELFIVIGIGGSYLGAKAAIDALGKAPDAPEVKFAGINLSATYHARLLEEMAAKEVCLCVMVLPFSGPSGTVRSTGDCSIFSTVSKKIGLPCWRNCPME